MASTTASYGKGRFGVAAAAEEAPRNREMSGMSGRYEATYWEDMAPLRRRVGRVY